ncbi:uncharacterized protein LOC118356758 [Zalophus californianus]|uniref:Uncharacterized protein LOC118356758 n=1 Tax=Zalophus californianus TaxID=9704 RepID=A0A6P9FK00_ZALCA|nr:uncharacterized protein LOC118356758 [Zalophus californianus]
MLRAVGSKEPRVPPPARRAGFRFLPGPRVRGTPAPLEGTRSTWRRLGTRKAQQLRGKAPQAHIPAACVRETPAARAVRGSAAPLRLRPLRPASGRLWSPPAAGFPTQGRGGARDRHSLLFRVGRAPGGPGRGRLWAAIPDVRISALFLASSPDGGAQRCSLEGPLGLKTPFGLVFFLPLRLTLVTCAGHPLRVPVTLSARRHTATSTRGGGPSLPRSKAPVDLRTPSSRPERRSRVSRFTH